MSRVLHRTGAIPPIAVSGDGIWLHTADGRRVIDASGGAAVAALGHGNRRVAEAIARQASTMAYAHTGTFSNQPAEDLAEILLHDEPGGLTRAWFCSSGSEGNEAALKLARQYFLEIGQPGRVRTIARRQSYHGTTLGALAAGGNMMRREYYEPILSTAHSLVSPCFAYRFKYDGETDAAYLERLSVELEAEFQRVGPDTVIAFLAEPVVGATTGCVAAIPGYFKRVREICDWHGALLILDEVMCGMGRTGTMHAWEQEGITPDIQVIAKGLGGGYQPIGGILIVDYFLIRRARIDLPGLYRRNGPYWYCGGINPRAVIAFALGVLPCLPGFLGIVGVHGIAPFWTGIYDYAWFISLGIAGVSYWIMMMSRRSASHPGMPT